MQGNGSKMKAWFHFGARPCAMVGINPIVLASGGVTLSGPVTGMEKAELQPTEGRSAKINSVLWGYQVNPLTKKPLDNQGV